MLATLDHPTTLHHLSPIDAASSPDINWARIRNAIRKRLRHHFRVAQLNWCDFDDATQDACGFAIASISRGIAPGLSVFRAVGRVKRGQTFVYEPLNRQCWEERLDMTRSLNGVGAATRRASAGLPLSGRTVIE